MSSSIGGMGLLGSSSSGASSVWNNPQILGALLPGYNISALDQAMQAQLGVDALPLNQLSQQLSTVNTQEQAWQQLQTDVSNLQTDAQSLAGTGLYQGVSAASSAPTQVNVSTSASASGSPGTFQVSVSQLAQMEIDNSATQTSSSAALNQSGSFTINGQTISVASTDSLQSISHSINAASDNVTATVMPTTGGYALNIASTQGTAIQWTDGSGILKSLGVLNSSATPANQLQAAHAAQYTVNGLAETGLTNTDNTTIPGVTLQLLAPTPSGSPATISVTQNQSAISGAFSQLAKDFNTLLGDVQKFGGKNGALEGNAALLSLTNSITQALTAVQPGQPAGYQSLSQIGVTLSAPVGSPSNLALSVSPTTLQTALADNPAAVAMLMNGASGGIATQLQQQLSLFVGPNGSIPAQISDLQQQAQSLGQEINDPNSPINQMIQQQQQQMQSQFSQMIQGLMASHAQSQQVSGFLQAQYAAQGSGGSGGSSSGG